MNQFHLLGRASCGERESIFLLKFCEESMAAESSGGGSLLLHRTLLFFFLFNKCKSSDRFVNGKTKSWVEEEAVIDKGDDDDFHLSMDFLSL